MRKFVPQSYISYFRNEYIPIHSIGPIEMYRTISLQHELDAKQVVKFVP